MLNRGNEAGHAKETCFTIVIALLLLLPGTTSAATVLATISRIVFGVEDSGQTETPGAWEGKGIDCESAACLSCHDGVTASDSPVGQKSTHSKGLGGSGRSHSIGASYSRAFIRRPTEYVAEGALDPAIRLVDGMVSCVSCHVTRAGRDTSADGIDGDDQLSNPCTASKSLVINNMQSRLCFACHCK